MKHLWLAACLVSASPGGAVSAYGQPVVINEIMYHPAPENPREDYVELHNNAATNVVGDWIAWTVTHVNCRTFTSFTPVLSYTRHAIELVNAQGSRADRVTCSDQRIYKTVMPAAP